MKYLRTKLTYANIGVTVALMLAASGMAVAASSNGSVVHACAAKSGALRLISGRAKCGRKEKAVSWNQTGPRGLPGLTGPTGATGATGSNGSNGTNGTNGTNGSDGTARAYGRVSSVGVATRSKNVTVVTNPTAGLFCIGLASSIDPTGTVLIVAPDYNGDSTDLPGTNASQSVVEWDSSGPDCSAGQFEVRTGYRNETTSGGNVTGVNLAATNQAFSFVVP